MKKVMLLSLATALIISTAHANTNPDTGQDNTGLTSFDFKIETTHDSQAFAFWVEDAANFEIDWGVGEGFVAVPDGNHHYSHEYASAGEYIVKVIGEASRISFFGDWPNPQGTPTLLRDILTPVSHGVTGITSTQRMFRNAQMESFTCAEFFDEASANVTAMQEMFKNTPFNQDLNNWDVSNVTNMYGMFLNSDFNGDISDWDVSNVTNTRAMFENTPFNQDIGSWNVENVTTMQTMFQRSSFNQDIGGWNVENVTNMDRMFDRAADFDQDISGWDVSSVRNFSNFLAGAELSAANYDKLLIEWSKLELRSGINFNAGNSQYNSGEPADARQYIIDTYNWTIQDGGELTSFVFKIETTHDSQAFAFWVEDAANFEVDWGVGEGFVAVSDGNHHYNHEYASAGEYIVRVIGEASRISFFGDWPNPQGTPTLLRDILTPVSHGVTGITSTQRMFRNAQVESFTCAEFFDEASANVTAMQEMFKNTPFNQDLNNWDVSNVTNMYGMFLNSDFNGDISDWDVSNVTNTRAMFENTPFNQDIGSWNVENVTTMRTMFQRSSFNQDIGSWNVENVTNMDRMFQNASDFNQNLSYWCVSNIPSEPFDFSSGSPLEEPFKPSWGMCPAITPPSFSPEEGKFTDAVEVSISSEAVDIEIDESEIAVFYTLDGTKPNEQSIPYTEPFTITETTTVKAIAMANVLVSEVSEATYILPSLIELVYPENEAVNAPIMPVFTWSEVTGAAVDYYELQLSDSDNFEQLILDISDIEEESYEATDSLNYLETYYWRVRGIQDSSADEWSDVWSFTTRIQSPSVVELVTPDTGSYDISINPKLSWTESERAEYYQIKLASDSEFEEIIHDTTGIEKLSFSPETLSYNTHYFWKVKAINAGGESPWSDTWSFYTEYALEQPVLVSPEQEVEKLEIPVTFHWNPVAEAKDYVLQIALDENFETLLIPGGNDGDFSEKAIEADSDAVAKQPGNWMISQKVDDFDYDTQYFWRVKALGDEGQSDWSETRSLTTEDAPFTTLVTLLAPGDESSDVSFPIELAWSAFEGADSYDVQLSESSSFEQTYSLNDFEGTSHEFKELKDSTMYFWRVRAKVGEQRSEWSEIWSFTTELRIPEVPVWEPAHEENDVETSPLLVWKATDRSDRYDIQLTDDPEFSELIIEAEALEDTEFQVSEELEKGATYYWRVRAGNQSGYSDWSKPLSFTTIMPTDASADEEIPETFTLTQNYPNPFNPSTQIRFAIPEQAHVTLNVYNLLGQQIARLVNETRQPGWHDVTFDASELSSGIYIYRLDADGYMETRQMMFVK